MNNYKLMYMGFDFWIHVQYATMMNITFTTLMYGLAMPILFPLGALAIYM